MVSAVPLNFPIDRHAHLAVTDQQAIVTRPKRPPPSKQVRGFQEARFTCAVGAVDIRSLPAQRQLGLFDTTEIPNAYQLQRHWRDKAARPR